MKKLKKIMIYVLIFFPVSNGFEVPGAKQWVEKVHRVLRKNRRYRLKDKVWALKRGYAPQTVEKFGLNEANLKKRISEKDYWYLQPVNGVYTKWLDNKVITRKIFSDFGKYFQNLYYQIKAKNDGIQVFPLEDCPMEGQAVNDILSLIKTKRKIVVTEPRRYRNALIEYLEGGFFCNGVKTDEKDVINFITGFHKRAIIAEYVKPSAQFKNNNTEFGNLITVNIVNRGGNLPEITDAFIRVDDCFVDNTDEIKRAIESYYNTEYTFEKRYKKEAVLENKLFYNTDILEKGDEERLSEEQYFDGIIVPIDRSNGKYEKGIIPSWNHLIEVEDRFTNHEKLYGKIVCWGEITTVLEQLCRHTPQLEFFSVDILVTDQGFKIMPFINVPEYPRGIIFSEETTNFLLEKLKGKKEYCHKFKVKLSKGGKKIKMKIRKLFTMAFFPKDLKPYLSIRWISEVANDFFFNKDVSISNKFWAYKHGFLSYRLEQYGITRNNYLDFISDFEYKWLRHINGSYRAIFEDKITVKYIVNKFKDCFPEYYYHIKTANNENIVIPMMDCPREYGNDFSDIFTLVEDKGVLALKPDEGSHGDGFYKFYYKNGDYYLNFDKVDKRQVLEILRNPDNQYLVTEYINNHPQFKAIYDGAVNTIRMIVFKRDGKTPIIGNAYMRFGSKKTGAVDNMGAGGMFVQIDLDTGRYHNAKIITHNSIRTCPYHPDTGVLMDGIVPHWEQIKETVLAVAESIPQMEYFGFDVAVTENGIKFPEINRFPDYPKIEKFSLATNKYLLYKLEQKKHKYGYDVKPCRKLVHLPKR